jgi:hypothetical protein
MHILWLLLSYAKYINVVAQLLRPCSVAGRLCIRFLRVSLEFFIDIILLTALIALALT